MIRQRVLTAVLLALGLLAALFLLPVAVAGLLFAGLLVIGAWEWAGLARMQGAGRAVYVAAALVTGAAAGALAAGTGERALLAWACLAPWLASLWWMFRYPVPLPRAFGLVSGVVALPLAWVLIMDLLGRAGPAWVLFLFAIVAAADVGAFFSGRAFGRHKLAPRVSPGKTWEGVAGGMTLVALVGTGGAAWFGLAPLGTALAAMVVASVSIVGDLTVSMLKRASGVKDSGHILPGHGGVLDRVDSLLAALPVYYLALDGSLP